MILCVSIFFTYKILTSVLLLKHAFYDRRANVTSLKSSHQSLQPLSIISNLIPWQLFAVRSPHHEKLESTPPDLLMSSPKVLARTL